jgi:uncharacterized protein
MAKKTETPEDALLLAVQKGDKDYVLELLTRGVNPNAKKKGKSALDLVPHRADEIKCLLIEFGARQTSLKGDLVWAVGQGRPLTVKALIEYGADINLVAPIGTPIMAALEKGCDECVEMLLEAGCDVELTTTISGPLSKAIEARRPDLLERLLKAGCPPDQVPGYGGCPGLVLAVETGCAECVGVLLQGGAEPNSRASMVMTIDPLKGTVEKYADFGALHYAALLGHEEIVRYLLQHGADPALKDERGKTADYWARHEGHQQVLSLLEECGSLDVENDLSETLLLTAQNGDLAEAETALKLGADVECRDTRVETKGFTPLQLAVKHGRSEMVRFLVSKGADVNATQGGEKIPSYLLSNIDDVGTIQEMGYALNRSPLILSLLNGDIKLAEFLVSQGADPQYSSALGESPVHLAAGLNSVSLLEILHAAKVKIDKAGRSRTTPLMTACEEGATEAVQWLLEHKAKPNRTDSDGQTPLTLAAGKCHLEVVRLLLEAGAELHPKTPLGEPLALAAGAVELVPLKPGQKSFILSTFNADGAFTYAPLDEQRVLQTVRLLLHGGTDPKRASGNTPALCAAARSGHLEVVKLLLDAGANPRAQDFVGNTAYDTAKMFNRDEVADFLKPLTGKRPRKPKVEVPEEVEFNAKYAPVPSFAKKLTTKKFESALQELSVLCGSEPVVLDNHAEIHVRTSSQDTISVSELQSEYLKKYGYFLIECSGNVEGPVKLALFPSKRWEDALAVFQTNGINYDVASQNIIDWFREWEPSNPFRLLTIAHDVVGGRFLDKIRQPKALAKSIYELCPDTVEQGLGSLEELTKDIKENRQFYLWWD